jgi:hypothetical protein
MLKRWLLSGPALLQVVLAEFPEVQAACPGE